MRAESLLAGAIVVIMVRRCAALRCKDNSAENGSCRCRAVVAALMFIFSRAHGVAGVSCLKQGAVWGKVG